MLIVDVISKLTDMIDRIKYYNETLPMLETLEALKLELEETTTEWTEGYEAGCSDIISCVLKQSKYKTRGDMIEAAEKIIKEG